MQEFHRRKISIVVKGDLTNAVVAARDHKVYALSGREINDHESVIWSNELYIAEIAAWFAENPTMIPSVGYPVGTCLVYSWHDDKQECTKCHGSGYQVTKVNRKAG